MSELGESLDRLSGLARQKQEHVRADDLIGLDEVLKQEQAMTLTLRGLEQRRLKLVSQLGLEGTGLDDLPEKFPDALRPEARQTVDAVRESYSLYRSCADAARNMLEVNLHEMERLIAASGAAPAAHGAGYQAPGVEPPKNMKTDFRA